MWEPKTNNEGDSMIVQPFASHEALIYQARGVQEDIQKDSSQAAHLMSDHKFCERMIGTSIDHLIRLKIGQKTGDNENGTTRPLSNAMIDDVD
jgi:hypothetical protein